MVTCTKHLVKIGSVVPKIADRQTHTTRSTQPCIPPRSLNRVPASAGGKGGNVTSAGWQVTLCDTCGMRVPVAVWQPCELLYTCYLLTYLHREIDRQTRSLQYSALLYRGWSNDTGAWVIRIISTQRTIRYDARCCSNVRSKADMSQLNLLVIIISFS